MLTAFSSDGGAGRVTGCSEDFVELRPDPAKSPMLAGAMAVHGDKLYPSTNHDKPTCRLYRRFHGYNPLCFPTTNLVLGLRDKPSDKPSPIRSLIYFVVQKKKLPILDGGKIGLPRRGLLTPKHAWLSFARHKHGC